MEMLIYIRDYQNPLGYQIGDIVEVRPDGYWSKEHGYNINAFKLVCLEGIEVNESLIKQDGLDRRQLNEGHEPERRKVQRRKETRQFRKRRYNISALDSELPLSKDNIGTDIIEKDADKRI